MPKIIAEVAIPISIALNEQFDYLVPGSMLPKVSVGCRVLVPFRASCLLGYVVRLKNSSPFASKLKPVLENLDERPVLDDEFFSLARKIQNDYFCSFADAIETVLPQGIKKSRKPFPDETRIAAQKILPFDLSEKESLTLSREELKKSVVLVQDLTNLDRWAIYGALIKKTLNAKKSVIFMVPDQEKIRPAIEFLKIGFEPFIFNSRVTQRESLKTWITVKDADFSFCLGTRSAVFAPVKNLGLIIIEEEDHFAYRQDQVPHYRTADIALQRSLDHNAQLVLGSFPLSLDAYYDFKESRASYLKLKRQEAWPLVRVLDMRHEFRGKGRERVVSKLLEYHLANCLERKDKILVFSHQKGFSTFLYCQNCKKTQTCPRCSSSLRYHFKEKILTCPTCSFKTASYEICPHCRSAYVKYSGFGLEKVESELARLFPTVKIGLYEKAPKEPFSCDIMLATQQFLEDPYVSRYVFDSVCLLSCDQMFGHIDFRSTEKTYARLLRLLSLAKKEMSLETHMVDNFAFKFLNNGDADGFMEQELKERKDLKLPPVLKIATLTVRSLDETKARDTALGYYNKLNKGGRSYEVFEPLGSIPFKVRGNYRYQILIKYKKLDAIRKPINKIIGERSRGVIATFDPSPL